MLLARIILSVVIGGLVATSGPRRVSAQGTAEARPPSRLTQASNELGAKVLAQLGGSAPASNVVVSPYSLDSALGMLTLAADGKTLSLLRAFRGTEGAPGNPLDDAFKQQQALFSASTPDVVLRIANSAWLKPNIMPRLAFTAGLQYLYNATLSTVDFAKPGTADIINAWVKDKTEGAIAHVVDALDAQTEFLLVNTTYFKGKWAVPFEVSATHDAPFTRFDGSRHDVPVMNATVELAYAAVDQWHAVKIAYAGDRFEMAVVTSKDPAEAASLRDKVGATGVLNALAAAPFEPQEVTLSLPRFRADYGADLTAALGRLGLAAAFGRSADYRAISRTKLRAAAVIQRCIVEVAEQGTVAAAATAIGATRALGAREPVAFAADRPFYFAIIDRTTGTLLFMGLIADPAA